MTDIEKNQYSKEANVESDLAANNYRLNSINERLESLNLEFRDSFDTLNELNKNNKKGVNQEGIGSELENQSRLNAEKNLLLGEKDAITETINKLGVLKKELDSKANEKINIERQKLQQDVLTKESTLKKKEIELSTEKQILAIKTKEFEKSKIEFEKSKTKLEEFEKLNTKIETDGKIEKVRKESGETLIKGEAKKGIKVLKEESPKKDNGGLSDDEMSYEPKEDVNESTGMDNLIEKVIQYTVMPGDTLLKISRKYYCDINDLIELNRSTIKNKNLIKPGQTLQVRIIETIKK